MGRQRLGTQKCDALLAIAFVGRLVGDDHVGAVIAQEPATASPLAHNFKAIAFHAIRALDGIECFHRGIDCRASLNAAFTNDSARKKCADTPPRNRIARGCDTHDCIVWLATSGEPSIKNP